MSGPRDRYDKSAMRGGVDDSEEDLSKPLPPHERWRVRIQDESAAVMLYDAATRYNRGERVGVHMFVLDEMAHAYQTRTLEHERLRLDRERWTVVARTLVTFIRAEQTARREESRARELAERATTTRRIIQPTKVAAASPTVIAPSQGALYARRR